MVCIGRTARMLSKAPSPRPVPGASHSSARPPPTPHAARPRTNTHTHTHARSPARTPTCRCLAAWSLAWWSSETCFGILFSAPCFAVLHVPEPGLLPRPAFAIVLKWHPTSALQVLRQHTEELCAGHLRHPHRAGGHPAVWPGGWGVGGAGGLVRQERSISLNRFLR